MLDKENETTWRATPKDDPKDRVEVIVGDDKQPDFLPQAKVQRWDNEVNVSLRLQPSQVDEFGKDGEKVRSRKGQAIEAEFFEKTSTEDNFISDEGAFEIEAILHERPTNDEIEYSLETKGVEFYYQPPLDESVQLEDGQTATATHVYDEDGNEIQHRPEHVVDSFAIYTAEDKTNTPESKDYKVGKVGHIYRPKIVDDTGSETWGSLRIEGGSLYVEVPSTFLDRATYPVNVDPTFGYDTVGGSHLSEADEIAGSHFTLSDKANVSQISWHVGNIYTEDGDPVSKTAIYRYSDDSLEVESGEKTLSDTGWKDYSVSSTISGGEDYWIVKNNDYHDSGFTGYVTYAEMSADSADDGKGTQTTDNYPDGGGYSFPSSFTPSPNYYEFSIYATYTVANSAPDAPSNPSPSDGATGVSLDPTLSVDVSDPDGDSMDVSFYDDSDNSLIGTDNSVSSGGTASVTWSGLNAGTTYSWYAVADDGSATTGSSTWSFTTALSAPTNVHFNDTATEDELTLDWDEVSGAAGYYVYRAQASGSSTSDYTQVADVTSPPYTDTGLEDGEQYYYRVSSHD